MSSVKVCEKHIHRKPEVSYATLIDVGLVGPKPRPKGVGDGQPVNIPAPPPSLSRWGTQSGKLIVPTGHGASFRHSRRGSGGETRSDSTDPTLSRKAQWFEEGARTANRHW
jgi:hypothetical protein